MAHPAHLLCTIITSDRFKVGRIGLNDSTIAIVFVIFGLILIVDHRRAARIAVEQQYRWFGLRFEETFHKLAFVRPRRRFASWYSQTTTITA